MIVNGGRAGGVDYNGKPRITFDGKWSGWYIEVYDGVPYWEALFSTDGYLVALSGYTADLWGIGGGGAGGNYYNTYASGVGPGGGSGYTNMVENVEIAAGGHPVVIGAGGTSGTDHNVNTAEQYRTGDPGGATTFLSLTCEGGKGGCTSSRTAGGEGGSNGGTRQEDGGANGTPGAGKIMSKFWSVEHNTEYGSGGKHASNHYGGPEGGGGGYMEVGGTNGTDGRGYGGGGGGSGGKGKSGCLIIRIKAE